MEQVVFFEAAGTVIKICLSLKPNHNNQVKLVQIPDIHCSKRGTSLRQEGITLTGGQDKFTFLLD